jgi:hypothetical protein
MVSAWLKGVKAGFRGNQVEFKLTAFVAMYPIQRPV